ncbi:MAG: Tex family protein [Planctomycetaceae bacterium]
MDARPVVPLSAVAAELKLELSQVESVVALADEGNTVPFITRYRKERTGNLDEQQIRAVLTRVAGLRQVAERAATIIRLIETQGRLTPALRRAIEQADSLKRLEDLYLPYKPKKQTRAATARERGLEPLAERIWSPDDELLDLTVAALALVDPDKGLPEADAVLQGAADILAERISEDAEIRGIARRLAWSTGKFATSALDEAAEKSQPFRDYFNHSEPVSRIPPHRVLAFNRGESAGALRVKFEWDQAEVQAEIARHLLLDQHRFAEYLWKCLTDAVDRLIHPALEREVRRELTERAESQAVAVFARNLRNLLLQPPLSGRRVLAIDPGFRTGCKTAVLDENGNLLASDVIYATGSAEKRTATRAKVAGLLREHDVRLVAIGNGTACRETEELIAEMIAEQNCDARYVIVNEAGASIYSTSEVAREEFPELDATVRGTVSIGRRLQDPLSELVKIEPQHIGVGMYQHDVNSKTLRESLDQVIESCVNFVGVDVNTASAPLLSYVSGLNQLTARRIVEWRGQHGPFRSRAQLLDVPGIGQATFTQAAGFLKLRDGEEQLDGTWIHPESYSLARQVLSRLNGSTDAADAAHPLSAETREKLAALNVDLLASELQAGVPTLRDIIDALARPGRDPRSDLTGPIFKKDVLKFSDLQPGMELRGTVLNVVDFGAFVDVGLKESGLVHVSQMSTGFVRSPHDKVSVGDVITVWVVDVDAERKRVRLSLIRPGSAAGGRGRKTNEDRKQPAASQAAPAAASGADSAKIAAASGGAQPQISAAPTAAEGPAIPRKPHHKPRPPAPPLSAAAKNGDEPLRSFGQLKQFWNQKNG